MRKVSRQKEHNPQDRCFCTMRKLVLCSLVGDIRQRRLEQHVTAERPGEPLGQRGFTKASGGGDESEFVAELEALIESFDQMRAGDKVRP